jgi:hypothetical protein
MTRAKSGTIILNEVPITSIEDLISIEDFKPEKIQPLTNEVINKSKEERITKITTYLNPQFDLKYDDFSFNKSSENVKNNVVNSPLGEDAIEGDTVKEGVEELDKLKFYSFYNDVNVKVESSDGITTLISRGGLNTGLSFLTDPITGAVSMSTEEYEKIKSEMVNLKYSVLSNLNKSNFLPDNNPFLNRVFGNLENISQELVVRKSIYNKDTNAPQDKLGNIEGKHLSDKEIYVNVYLKLTVGSEVYYLQLLTAPNKTTIAEYFGADSELFIKYNDLLNNNEIIEKPISSSLLTMNTSTRFLKRAEGDKEVLTLEALNKIPGIKFWE